MSQISRFIARISTVIGATGCVLLFACSIVLISHHAVAQPQSSQVERDWPLHRTLSDPTLVRLATEEVRLLWILRAFVPCLYLIVLGQAIDIYAQDDYREPAGSRGSGEQASPR